MISSKLTSKYQATIPKDIRKTLNLNPGDRIVFYINQDGNIVVKKASSINKSYLKSLSSTLSEWESEEDERAFKHLQTL